MTWTPGPTIYASVELERLRSENAEMAELLRLFVEDSSETYKQRTQAARALLARIQGDA